MIMPKQFTHKILTLHTSKLEFFLQTEPPPRPAINSMMTAVLANHYFNCRLWLEEDLARRSHVADAEIVANKRAIDRYNQARNDAVERLDEYLLSEYFDLNERAPLCSETPGAMIDRLSIISLKQHHMALQTVRFDVEPMQRIECQQKLERLHLQRVDLALCLQRLLMDCQSGTGRFKVYRQFKMYNDARYQSSVDVSGTVLPSNAEGKMLVQ